MLTLLKDLKIYKFVASIVEVIVLWGIIISSVFSFNRFIGNELDILPSARQFYNPAWLPNDWYLNLNIGYRQAFYYSFGFLVDWFDFLSGAYIGRLIVYLALAIALAVFFRAIKLRFSLGLIVTLLFLENQSLIAGEWIAGGVDPKTLAYAFALLSFSFFVKHKYLVGFAFAGAALSFHVLVGIYALICSLFALILTDRERRKNLKNLVLQSWPFFITGLFGILAIIQHFIASTGIDENRAWQIYVEFRVPHHVLPSSWQGDQWIITLTLATILFLLILLVSKNHILKFTAAYALASSVIFITGLVIFAAGRTTLLRYYLFRYPDVIIPFLTLVLLALVINQLTNLNFTDHPQIKKYLNWSQSILSRGIPLLLIFIAISFAIQSARYLQGKYHRGLNRKITPIQVAGDWIKENTPPGSEFLVNPFIIEFYTYANRARFVSFNHSPQSAPEILEWYERLTLSNGGQQPGIPLQRGEIESNFYQLDEDQILQIADTYGLKYYLGSAGASKNFEQVYENDTFILYEIYPPPSN